MKLLMTATSPYARKVRSVAIEKGVAHQMKEVLVDPTGEDTSDLLVANPLGKVPALVLEDGRHIYDSTVICEYLDSIDTVAPLLPPAGEKRIDTLVRQALANGIIDAALNSVLERKRAETQRSAFWLSRWQAAIDRAVGSISEGIEPDRVDLGDLTAAIALLYLDFRLPYIEWRKTYPVMAKWADRMARRPSLSLTAPPAA